MNLPIDSCNEKDRKRKIHIRRPNGSILDLYLRKVEDRYKGGNHSYRNVNNNNHNNSLLFSRCLFDAAFSSGHEWVERVEPHPLPAPFFLPPPRHLHHHRRSTPATLTPPLSFLTRNIYQRLQDQLYASYRSRRPRMKRGSASMLLLLLLECLPAFLEISC